MDSRNLQGLLLKEKYIQRGRKILWKEEMY